MTRSNETLYTYTDNFQYSAKSDWKVSAKKKRCSSYEIWNRKTDFP
jgi:hypothetical protein